MMQETDTVSQASTSRNRESQCVTKISVTLRPGSSVDMSWSESLQKFYVLRSSNGSISKVEDVWMAKKTKSQAKLNLKRLELEAKIASELRDRPKINPASKKIAKKQLSYEFHEEKAAEIAKTRELDLILKGACSFLTPKSAPKSLTTRESSVSDTKLNKNYLSMELTDRTNYWLEQKNAKLERQRETSRSKELIGCTFKPNLLHTNLKNPPKTPDLDRRSSKEIVNSYLQRKLNRKSELLDIKTEELELKLRVPPPNPPRTAVTLASTRIKKTETPYHAPILSPSYSQLTPYYTEFRYQSGQNMSKFITTARPMVDYKF